VSTWSVTHSDETTQVGNRAYFRGSIVGGAAFPGETHGCIVVAGEMYRPGSAAEAEDPNKGAIEPFRSIREDNYKPWVYQDDGVFVAIEEFAPQTFKAFVERACDVSSVYGLTDIWCIPHHRDLAIQACEQAYHVVRKRMSEQFRNPYGHSVNAPVFAPIQIERSQVELQRESLIRALVERKHLLVDANCNLIRSQNMQAVEALGCALFALYRYRPRRGAAVSGGKRICDSYYSH
jgi:hypothetical protein